MGRLRTARPQVRRRRGSLGAWCCGVERRPSIACRVRRFWAVDRAA